ncbi:MAG: 2Fe-2S iron-sulfur cluster-binding protein [Gammaproteobacteria bacterium]
MTYTVTIRSYGDRFTVEAGETILQAGLRQGVTQTCGCHGGMCGVCISRIIDGRITYPDGPPLALAEEDAGSGKGLVCVGYPGSDLVIEPVNSGVDWELWE